MCSFSSRLPDIYGSETICLKVFGFKRYYRAADLSFKFLKCIIYTRRVSLGDKRLFHWNDEAEIIISIYSAL